MLCLSIQLLAAARQMSEVLQREEVHDELALDGVQMGEKGSDSSNRRGRSGGAGVLAGRCQQRQGGIHLCRGGGGGGGLLWLLQTLLLLLWLRGLLLLLLRPP